MSSKFRWKPKRYNNHQKPNTSNHYKNKKTYDKRSNYRKSYHKRNNNRSQSNNRTTWKPRSDLRLEIIKYFVAFFTSKHHPKHEIENADVYIDQLLTKLNKNDISILLNHTNKTSIINNLSCNTANKDIYNFYKNNLSNFSPLSHCIFNIGTCWKYHYMDDKYQLFFINEWIKIIKLLLNHNANPFQCIYCFKDLNIYDQYCYCVARPKSTSVVAAANRNIFENPNKRVRNKLHSTPFKHLFLFFRQDLHQASIDKKIEKNSEFWWIKTEKILTKDEENKYSNVHNALFCLLEFILNKYDEILPLMRCQFGKIHLGPTPGYCDYEWRLIPFHVIFPVFPCYNILYKLLSIKRIVPFRFVNFAKYCSQIQIQCKVDVNERFSLLSDFGRNLWNDRNVYKFIKNHSQQAFAIAQKYSKRLEKYECYDEYEDEYGFGSFYEDICQYLAYTEPNLVHELCEYSPDGEYNAILIVDKYEKKESRIVDCIYDCMNSSDVETYFNKYDHNSGGMKDDFPINWSIPVLYTMQQIKNTETAAAILFVFESLSDNIISLILEWSYFNIYDQYFDGPQFLSNYDNIQKCMLLMKKYNIFNDENKTFIPFKHRTTNFVINSWLNAFKNIKFKHEFFKPILTLNEKKLEERRKMKMNKLNKNKFISHFYIKNKNKFEKLIDVLIQFKHSKIVIVCQENETVNKLAMDLLQQQDITSLRFCKLGDTMAANWLFQCDEYGMISSYENHKKDYKNNGYAEMLILYDIPLNIDEYISQINGYSNIISLVSETEYKNQCIGYKEKYDLNMIEFRNNNSYIQSKHKLILKNIKLYFVDVEKDDYKFATLIDLYETMHHQTHAIIYCNSNRKVKWLKQKMAKLWYGSKWIITDCIDDIHSSSSLLLHYDLPTSNHQYFYRIIRAMKIIIHFVTDDEQPKFTQFQTFYNLTITELPMDVDQIFN